MSIFDIISKRIQRRNGNKESGDNRPPISLEPSPSTDENELDEADLKNLRVVDLKNLLRDKSKKLTGKKSELIDRLLGREE